LGNVALGIEFDSFGVVSKRLGTISASLRRDTFNFEVSSGWRLLL
jgi:hypothetical protein